MLFQIVLKECLLSSLELRFSYLCLLNVGIKDLRQNALLMLEVLIGFTCDCRTESQDCSEWSCLPDSLADRVKEEAVLRRRRYSYRDSPFGCSLLLYYLRKLFNSWSYLVDQISDILNTRMVSICFHIRQTYIHGLKKRFGQYVQNQH